MERILQQNAYAKINLGLDVIRRREDGYHEVRMVMQTVRLYDRLTFRLLSEDEIRIRTNRSGLPTDENNLIYRAVRYLKDTYQVAQGMEILLDKYIPVAAGMAGGSTDCATALRGANELFDLHLDGRELAQIGVRLGADVPYCLMGGTALSEGIGEQLTQLPALPPCWILIAKPPVSVSTKWAYERFDEVETPEHPDIPGMTQAIRDGDLARVCAGLGNGLESVTIPEYPVIAQIKECMRDGGAMNALMSGSGPTVFGIYEDKKVAAAAGHGIVKSGLARQIYLVDAFDRMAEGR